MNFYYYSKHILKILDDHEQILDLIFSVANKKEEYIITPQRIIGVKTHSDIMIQEMVNLQNFIKRQTNDILKILRSERPNDVYKMINTFLRDLIDFDSSFNDTHQLITLLSELPEAHTDAYSEKESAQIFSFMEICIKIKQSIDDIKKRAEYIVLEHEKTLTNIPRDYSPLSISTDQDLPLLEDFIIVFKNIDDLYNFICFIYKVDKDKYPLIMNSVQTGSWFTDLLGMEHVVKSIENLLNGLGQFIRDLITGKIDRERFENKCKKSEAFIELVKNAKENGIDNAEVGLIKNLNQLMISFKKDTTTIIEINDKEILNMPRLDKMTLLEKMTLREKLVQKINLSIETDKKDTEEES